MNVHQITSSRIVSITSSQVRSGKPTTSGGKRGEGCHAGSDGDREFEATCDSGEHRSFARGRVHRKDQDCEVGDEQAERCQRWGNPFIH
jgi:hypothetical protein